MPKPELGFIPTGFTKMPDGKLTLAANCSKSAKIRMAPGERRGLTAWPRLWEIRQLVIQKRSGWGEPHNIHLGFSVPCSQVIFIGVGFVPVFVCVSIADVRTLCAFFRDIDVLTRSV